MSPSNFVTLSYKQVPTSLNPIDIQLDIYPPAFTPNGTHTAIPSVPAVIYFHGGGLTVGNRQSWFPDWLQKRTAAAGYAFISADYQLMTPATGHDILRDIQDLLTFVTSRDIELPSLTVSGDATHVLNNGNLSSVPKSFSVDPDAIAVAGTSAGGLCAYLAAMHCVSPKPAALVSLYGMGGDYFTPHYLTPKTEPFFRGREILDPRDFLDLLHPNHLPDSPTELTHTPFSSLQPVADSGLVYHPETYHTPGFPANPRMLLTRLYLQLGVFLDYYTGAHEDGGITVVLREALELKSASQEEFLNGVRALVPPQHHGLFPQFGVTSEWPPTIMLHGTADSAVPIWESRSLGRQLRACGVPVEIYEAEGAEHSFDYEPGAEEKFGDAFDAVGQFLERYIGGKRSRWV
ncbi:Alpha/Beta hydrolase protein, partial [Lyophyllum atratum]